ncbi:MAG: 2-dehydro-3-deoxygalactonokinase [Allorhizobium sp.]
MSGPAFCALADWGTSNFRLWLVDRDGNVLGERQSDEGLSAVTDGRFEAVLESHMTGLGAAGDIGVVAAGMVGARSGWLEAAYAETPASLGELYAHAVSPVAARPVYILPGLCQKITGAFDVMRGEETQLAGAVASGLADGVFCLPGTHSKWVMLSAGRVETFRTVMTGELFSLISRQSILRLSVDAESRTQPDDPVFTASVEEALRDDFSLTASLFSIRAAGLLSSLSAAAGAAHLSGLLIGAELAGVRTYLAGGGPVYLIGSSALNPLYTQALSLAGQTAVPLDGGELVRKGLLAAAQMLFPSSKTKVHP